MIGEVIHTWDRTGLDGDGPGFTVVARTAGLSRESASRAAQWSGHRVGLDAGRTIAIRRIETAGGSWTLLSATAPCRDRGGGANRIAHHLIIEEGDLRDFDPAAALLEWSPSFEWDGPPRELEPSGRPAPLAPAPCRTWQTVVGDSGWAGVVAERLRQLQGETLVVLLPGQLDFDGTVGLAAELAAILPEAERRELTFSNRLGTSESPQLVILDDAAAAIAERPLPGGSALLDLRAAPSCGEGLFVPHARAGHSIPPSAARSLPSIGDREVERVEPSPSAWSGSIEVRMSPSKKRGPTGRILAVVGVVAAASLLLWLLVSSGKGGGP